MSALRRERFRWKSIHADRRISRISLEEQASIDNKQQLTLYEKSDRSMHSLSEMIATAQAVYKSYTDNHTILEFTLGWTSCGFCQAADRRAPVSIRLNNSKDKRK